MTWSSLKAYAPANIALIKYWGKQWEQIPLNPSLSLTLRHSLTQVELDFKRIKSNEERQLLFTFEKELKPHFAQKVFTFIKRIERDFPELAQYHLKINSSNTFPHSTGIASSASSFAALALVLSKLLAVEDVRLISHIARLGSGSASRSIQGGVNLWGFDPAIEKSSDEYAMNVDDLFPKLREWRDLVCVVDTRPKKTSSSKGHASMQEHPFTKARVAIAKQNLQRFIAAAGEGDEWSMGAIIESEAWMLHALMMSSPSAYCLLKPGTLAVIEAVEHFRLETGIFIAFTLDAGPNVHLLYNQRHQVQIESFFTNTLQALCEGGKALWDEVGEGGKVW